MLTHHDNCNQGSLVVLGTGIKFLSHLSTEAKANIQQADKLLYLVNDPLLQDWLQQANPSAESLDALYQKSDFRRDNYTAITTYILNWLNQGKHLCVVFYGHPGVFSKPGIDAVKIARQQGLQACLLPAISSEDCLFADLLIDPGTVGCQSYEATDLLIYQRPINPRSHLILWQIDVIGSQTNSTKHNNLPGMTCLIQYLQHYYPDQHLMTLYEAAQYPGFKPVITEVSLNNLKNASLSPVMSLYIPPMAGDQPDKKMLETLAIFSKA